LGYASPKYIRCPTPAYLPKEWSEGLLSSPDVRPFASADGLANLEVLELGMTAVEGLVLSGPMVSGPKGLGSGPGLERGPALPYDVRGIERMIFGLRTFEQVEFHKPRHRVEVIASSSGLFRLDARGIDHLAPFFGFFGDELREFAACHR
jgi:hypothetical protein